MYGEVATREVAVAPLHTSIAEPVSFSSATPFYIPCLPLVCMNVSTDFALQHADLMLAVQCGPGGPLGRYEHLKQYEVQRCANRKAPCLLLAQAQRQAGCTLCNARQLCSAMHVCKLMKAACTTCVLLGMVCCPCPVTDGAIMLLVAGASSHTWIHP